LANALREPTPLGSERYTCEICHFHPMASSWLAVFAKEVGSA
jgi:hypothetical protein